MVTKMQVAYSKHKSHNKSQKLASKGTLPHLTITLLQIITFRPIAILSSKKIKTTISVMNWWCITIVFGVIWTANQVEGLTFKIAVVIEDNLVNDTLINYAVTRRINFNYKVLETDTLSATTIKTSWCDTTATIKKVCSSSGYSGIITVGSCGLIDQINRLAASMEIPHIGLPHVMCDEPLATNFGVIGTHAPSDLFGASAAAFKFKKSPKVAIYYDRNQSLSAIQSIQSQLSAYEISSFIFQIDATGVVTSTILVNHMQIMLKKKTHNIIIIAERDNVKAILNSAITAKVLQQNYFWQIADTGVTKNEIMEIVPANANVEIIRGITFGVNKIGQCPKSVLDVFPECNTDFIRGLDARFVDAVSAIAKAFNDSKADTSKTWYTSNATCSGQTWLSGQNTYDKLKLITNYDSGTGIISYNVTTGYFNALGIELIGTYNHKKTTPTQMIEAATYDTNSKVITTKVVLRQQNVVFPNTFLGFKNETLTICSPVIPPFTSHLKEYANHTVEIKGMLLDLLQIFGKMLEFKYHVKNPDDSNWGGPVSGSSIYSGCVGEVQIGKSDIGGGPFTKTTTRDLVIDYSYPLFEEANAVLLPRPPPASKLWNVFTPFNYEVWLLICGFLLVAAFVTYIMAYFSPFTAWNLGLDYAIADEIWFQEYLWSIIGSFLQQGQDFYPFAMAPRTVLAFWWLFTVILFGTYTGDLTAHLTITVTTVPIKTLDDLVAQTKVKPYVPEFTNIHTLLLETKSGIYKQIADTMVLAKGIPGCADGTFNEGLGCITDYTFLLFLAKQNCSQVYLAEQLFNTATVAFMYPEDAYFAETFDYYFEKLHESGVMQHLFNNWWSSDAVCSVGNSAEADPINLEGVGGCFIVTGSFYVSGFLILAGEFIWTKVAKKEPLQCFFY